MLSFLPSNDIAGAQGRPGPGPAPRAVQVQRRPGPAPRAVQVAMFTRQTPAILPAKRIPNTRYNIALSVNPVST